MDNIRAMETKDLIGLAVGIDKRMKLDKQRLDALKAEITARGSRILDDSNSKYVKLYAKEGTAAVAETQKLDLIRADRLKELLTPDVWKAKVKETTETKYSLDARLERMLKAVFTGAYTFEYTMEDFVDTMFADYDPDAKQKAVLVKKLKGEFDKDFKLLCDTFGVPDAGRREGLFEVELWYIHRIKNAELIRMFFPEDDLEQVAEELKKCMIVDGKLSITIDYEGR